MNNREMMGFETPGDKKVPVTVRDWQAMRRAIWRSAKGWEIVANTAQAVIDGCDHAEGCPGLESDEAECLKDRYAASLDGPAVLVTAGCRDRELRASALVMLTAALQHAPRDVNKPTDEYFAPSREYFSEILSSLHAAQLEIEDLRARLTRDAQPSFFERIMLWLRRAPRLPPPKEIEG